MRKGSASIAANPILIGAATTLVIVVAVFLAYNANNGLPFVPTYQLDVRVPNAANLVKGNEVRIGGTRVGLVSAITPVKKDNGRYEAKLALKLQASVKPLPVDSTVLIRTRSALGLKYVEITKGNSTSGFAEGATIPIKQATPAPVEFDEFLGTFDEKTRNSAQKQLEGFGNAFAGRGQAINRSIQALNPFFKALTPVMQNLSDPRTELDQFFLQMGRASAQVAPVAQTQALLFTDMADTFAAISANPRALQDTIEKGAPTMEVSIDSFRVQRPFMVDFTDLSARLRPAAEQLPRSLPAINSAFKVGTPVLPRTVELNDNLEKAFNEANDLFENPNTLLALKDLTTAVTVTRPALEYIAPYQTVCSYFNYFMHPLGEMQSVVQTGPTGGGTVLNQNMKLPNSHQQNNYGSSTGSRPWDILPGQKPQGAKDLQGNPLFRLYATAYNPAIDAQGNADCQLGQTGYPNGALGPGRYKPVALKDQSEEHGLPIPEEVGSGTNGAITENNLPGLSGGTYKSRELGIDNLKDVP